MFRHYWRPPHEIARRWAPAGACYHTMKARKCSVRRTPRRRSTESQVSHRLCVGMGGQADALCLQPVPDESPQLGGGKEVVGWLRSSRTNLVPFEPAAASFAGALDRLLLLHVGLPQAVGQTLLPSCRGGGRHWRQGGLLHPRGRQARDRRDHRDVAGTVRCLCEARLLDGGSPIACQVDHCSVSVVQAW